MLTPVERILLIRPQDVDEDNVFPLLERGREIVARKPGDFDGWYLTGLCSYRLGRRRDALYALAMAHAIVPEERVSRMMADLEGSPERLARYRLGHALRHNRPLVSSALASAAVMAALVAAVLR